MDLILKGILIFLAALIFGIIIIQKATQSKNNKEEKKAEFKFLYDNNDSFRFELVQPMRRLLKKNTGRDLCEEQCDIEYVEYCDSISYSSKQGRS